MDYLKSPKIICYWTDHFTDHWSLIIAGTTVIKLTFSAKKIIMKKLSHCSRRHASTLWLYLGLEFLSGCGDFKNEIEVSCSTTHMIILVNDDRKKMIESGHSDSWWHQIILTQLLCFLTLTHYKFCSHLFHGNRNSKTEGLPSTNPSSPPMSPQKFNWHDFNKMCINNIITIFMFHWWFLVLFGVIWRSVHSFIWYIPVFFIVARASKS